jgi:transposase
VVNDLREIVAKQGAEIERLKARKPKTSRTSSKPPSSDAPWAKVRSPKKRSGKKRGGQPGHAPHQRPEVPPEDVDEVHCVKPESCSSCSAPLEGDDPSAVRHQIIDIPEVVPQVLEYELHRLTCSACGASTRAGLPDGVHPSSFGPNLTALVIQLTGQYRMSRRNAQRFVADAYGIDLSLGAISSMERRVAEGLAPAHAEAMESVAQSATKHLDETTWRSAVGALSWCWAAVGEHATAFLIRGSRKGEVAKELIGDEPSGVVISDRFSGYAFVDVARRQVCLAHIGRDFRGMAEGEKEHRWIGERLVGLMEALFHIWHRRKDGTIGEPELRRWARPIRARMIRLLDEGARSRGYETPSKCRGILQLEPAMWTFLHEPGVEPTNNAAERALRPLVIHRKTSLGTESDRGERFLERMHTVVETLRRKGESTHEFLRGVAQAVLSGGPLPRLLP